MILSAIIIRPNFSNWLIFDLAVLTSEYAWFKSVASEECETHACLLKEIPDQLDPAGADAVGAAT